MKTLETILPLIGAVFQVLGAILMAAQFANVPWYQLPYMLLSALWKGKFALAMVEIARLTGERPMEFVQGLAFICLGFLFQLLGSIVALVNG